MLKRLFAFIVLMLPLPAFAEWHEASSDHFVIYADQSSEQVQRFAERLERYHSAMHFLLNREGRKPSPSNRVTVYVVKNVEQVRKLFGTDSKYLGGFYVPRAGGTLAIVPRIEAAKSALDYSGERVLLHEYAHHVMYGSSAFSYPLWFSEGFAEFYGNAGFDADGSVGLGQPAATRLVEMMLAKNVPIELMLDTKTYLASRAGKKGYDEFYGRSWLLFHYLTFAPQRKGQLTAFLKELSQGKSDIEAARLAFGDLKALDKELDKYANRTKMSSWRLKPAALQIGEIRIRKLDEAEAASMPVRIRSRRGVDEEGAKEVLPLARAVAAKYPKSAAVMAVLAEAEYDAGNDDAAIAAADAALALDPRNVNAALQKGYAMAQKAKRSEAPSKAWVAVRKQFLTVNAIENDHPIPLIRFYESYIENGDAPTDNALEGYVWALQLAPFDKNLRIKVAEALTIKNRFDDAIQTLRPIANDPHNDELGKFVNDLIEKIEKRKAEFAEAAPTGTASSVETKI